MAIIQDIVNFVPSWQKHLDESGYLKAPGQTDYHQKAGYNFKENFPNTPAYVADALGKAYQYGTEGIGSFFSGSSFPEAMARAKEESRLNSLGFRGQGFNMDEYNQTMDFARKGFDQNTGLTYGSAQAADLPTNSLERDFPGMSTGDIIDSMNNRQRANRFSGMGQTGPVKSNMNAPAALDMDRFAGVSNLGRNDMDVEQVEQLGSPSRFQGFKNSIGSGLGSIRDFFGSGINNAKEGIMNSSPMNFLRSLPTPGNLLLNIAATRNPLNPRSKNYNPTLQGQIDYMKDKGMYGITDQSGLNKITGGRLAGKNLVSLFGSNDLGKMYSKDLARLQRTLAKFQNKPGSYKKKIEGINKKIAQNKIEAQAAQAAREAATAARAMARNPEVYRNAGITSGGFASQNTGTNSNFSNRTGRGRTGYSEGGLASMFTRRG